MQANYGDCFILEYGTPAAPRYLLIDGGPLNVFSDHLESELQAIADSGGKLDLVAVSHVDTDHIVGVMDLMASLRDQRTNGTDELIGINAIWHNSFSSTLDSDGEIQSRLNGLLGAFSSATPQSTAAVAGIGEGNRVRQFALQLGIPINDGFADNLICVDDAPDPIQFGNLSLQIVGPTRANLDELHDDWEEWLDKMGAELASSDPSAKANADISIPNLSSVMFLAMAHGKTILLTGDGRSDHLLSGLIASGLLSEGGTLHVDILKVMHHGSDRNATKKFFKTVTADTYVVSANGHPDNPDLATLIWIVEAAQAADRNIRLVFTNETPATRKLRNEYPPADYGYDLAILARSKHAMTLSLAD
nr:hypothetical protein [uncultured Dongia sp.]